MTVEGQWCKVNRALCDILGYAETELLTVPLEPVTEFDGWPAEAEAEVYAIPQADSVLSCRSRGADLEIAMAPGVLTGFLSWMESAPPGTWFGLQLAAVEKFPPEVLVQTISAAWEEPAKNTTASSSLRPFTITSGLDFLKETRCKCYTSDNAMRNENAEILLPNDDRRTFYSAQPHFHSIVFFIRGRIRILQREQARISRNDDIRHRLPTAGVYR